LATHIFAPTTVSVVDIPLHTLLGIVRYGRRWLGRGEFAATVN
jgi:hypothetical protein